MTNHGTNSAVIPDAWKSFYFDSTNVADAADPDGDGWSNLQEYQRGSDPTQADKPRLAIVGDENGWDWNPLSNTNSPRQMKYYGQGIWKFFRWIPLGTSGLSFKIGLGPTPSDPNWGAGANSTSDSAILSGSDFAWQNQRETWQVLTLNERNFAYRIESLAVNPPDSDGDGMPDDWERFHGLDPFANDAVGDKDADTVANLAEFTRGSSASLGDHFSEMWMPGDGDWTFSSKRKMVWNSSVSRWEYILYSAPRNFGVKFAADSGYATSWGWPATGGSNGVSIRNPATNITIGLSSNGHHRIRFEEISGRYEVGALSPADTNGDKLPDEWANYHGVSGATNDPDNDLWSNLAEFNRGMNPLVSDSATVPKRMTVSGSGFVPGWNPNLNNMTWSDLRNQWEWVATATNSGIFNFKFFQGTNWSDPDWGIDPNGPPGTLKFKGGDIPTIMVNSGTRYKIAFNDVLLTYSLSNYPASSEWWDTNNLPVNGLWFDDTDGDGNNQLMEFALGGDPNVAETNRLFSFWATNSVGTNRLVLRWNQRTNANVQAEWQTNLSGTGWSSIGLIISNVGSSANGMQPKEASVSIDSTNRKFLRLKVTGP
jgi:hypothetical protein